MALLKIARMGHPVLLQRALPVPDPAAPEMRRLVADMIDTMRDAEGIGLAAPQVHHALRLFVLLDGDSPRAFFNPTIAPEPAGESGAVELVDAWEGCLSIPGLRGLVPRPARIRWTATDGEGAPIAGVADGMLARVMQHEFDHLEGVLYPARMTDLSRLGFNEELASAARAERAARTAARRAARAEAEGAARAEAGGADDAERAGAGNGGA